MELRLLEKPQEIIIEYVKHLYEEGRFGLGDEYPYSGPIFDFKKNGQILELIDNTEYLHPNGKTWLPVHHGDFIEPKCNHYR